MYTSIYIYIYAWYIHPEDLPGPAFSEESRSDAAASARAAPGRCRSSLDGALDHLALAAQLSFEGNQRGDVPTW